MAIEEPAFIISRHKGAFEVRDYAALVAAEVDVDGGGKQARAAGFRLLARYIFGGNNRRQSIAMTAPVVQARPAQPIAMTALAIQTAKAGGWTLRFFMPRRYALGDLPAPNDQHVHLVKIPASRIAALRFSGLARPRAVERKTAELNALLAARHLPIAGPPSVARYNPPWTIWFLRRNEIWIPLRAEQMQRSLAS